MEKPGNSFLNHPSQSGFISYAGKEKTSLTSAIPARAVLIKVFIMPFRSRSAHWHSRAIHLRASALKDLCVHSRTSKLLECRSSTIIEAASGLCAPAVFPMYRRDREGERERGSLRVAGQPSINLGTPRQATLTPSACTRGRPLPRAALISRVGEQCDIASSWQL